jgi:membrane protease YdiL (CAAX protease family)
MGVLLFDFFTKKAVDISVIANSLPVFVASYIITFGGTVIFGWYLSKSGFKEVFPFTRFPAALIPAFIPLLLGLAVLLFEIMAVVTHIKPVSPWLIDLMRRLMEQSVVLALLAGGIIGPFLEELLFRGIIMRGFLDRYKPWQAILYSSLLFGILHLNIWQFCSATLLGLFLGWLYYKTRSLWPCFILHAIHNSSVTMTGTLVYTSLLGYPADVIDSSVMPFLPWWLVSIGIMLALAGVAWIHRILKNSVPSMPSA